MTLIQASTAALCNGTVAVPKFPPPRRKPATRFYPQQHKQSGGSDLPAKAKYVCILDQHGTKLLHKHLPAPPKAFLRMMAPYRDDVVVGGEGIFTWYWLAAL